MDRRIVKTKAAIEAAYLELLLENKPGRITITDVANRANIDRKTFYLHYGCVEDILREFCKNKADELAASLRRLDFPFPPFSLMQLFTILNQMVEDNLDIFRFLCNHPEYDFFFDQIKDYLTAMIVKNGQVYFSFTETELDIYAEFYISAIIAVYTKWIREGMPFPIEQLAEMVSDASYIGLKGLMEYRKE